MAEAKEQSFKRPQREQFVVVTPRTRITASAAFQTVKAATERLVEICVVAAGLLRVVILVELTSGLFWITSRRRPLLDKTCAQYEQDCQPPDN
jgi:hypothetical protein